MVRRVLVVAAVAAACGGHYGGAPPRHAERDAGKRGIEAAALPYTVLDARTGHQVDTAAFWERLAGQRAVCVGEEHPNPHHHWVQLEVVRRMAKQWKQIALGMEMFQRPFQGVLDDYAEHRIDAAALRSRAGWEDRWGYDFALYAPIIDAAVGAHGALIALNAAKELTKKVSHHGLESLTADERKAVPQLELNDAAHRAWFDALMEDMGGSSAHSKKPSEGEGSGSDSGTDNGNGSGSGSGSDAAPAHAGDGSGDKMPSADRIYTVQVIWDETMADGAARWLAATPKGRIVILAGTGHCHDSAIVGRLKRRGVAEVVSVRSVIDDGEGGVAAALAKPMNDFLVVLSLPPNVQKAQP
jgi:uncharacterized iron-regulated protein